MTATPQTLTAVRSERRDERDEPDVRDERQREHVDVLVVGAGISGIGTAYRLQTESPDRSYAILEARDDVGGTWDLFRYPGARSDSDMYTLGFPFEPWRGENSIADQQEILDYLRYVADKYGISTRIRFGHRVTRAEWSSEEARWTVTVQREDAGGIETVMTANWLHLCAGYYDYERPHEPGFAGVEDFTGQIVHPQFWPQDLEVADRRVVVIGSGATAMTLVPALAERGARVTMLQRTPTWVIALPRRSGFVRTLANAVPGHCGHDAARFLNVVQSRAIYRLSRRRPALLRAALTGMTRKGVGAESVSAHFSPPYDPWDQRLCVVPDGDLFTAIRSGLATVVTDTVDRFTTNGIRLGSGQELPADVIVTATGLRLRMAGGVQIVVDGTTHPTKDLLLYRGTMFAGVPNLSVSIGYINASWTLRADLTSRYLCRVLNHMRDNGFDVATPQAPQGVKRTPLLPVSAGYVTRAADILPSQGDSTPWLMEQDYLHDRREMAGDIAADMQFRSVAETFAGAQST